MITVQAMTIQEIAVAWTEGRAQGKRKESASGSSKHGPAIYSAPSVSSSRSVTVVCSLLHKWMTCPFFYRHEHFSDISVGRLRTLRGTFRMMGHRQFASNLAACFPRCPHPPSQEDVSYFVDSFCKQVFVSGTVWLLCIRRVHTMRNEIAVHMDSRERQQREMREEQEREGATSSDARLEEGTIA